jgi:branched-subunit amino acid transport protein
VLRRKTEATRLPRSVFPLKSWLSYVPPSVLTVLTYAQ